MSPPLESLSALLPGTRVERYLVESRLGAGHSTTTYRVRHATLGTLHALMVPNITHPGLLAQLVAGARIQARQRHPGVVAVTDVLDLGGLPALVLDHVDGPTLEDFVASHRLDEDATDALAHGLFDAVSWLHGNSVVHRNLKPPNVFVDLAGKTAVPKVSGFTFARGASEADRARRKVRVFGTPQFMAPEQTVDSDAVDHRADLWSLGCMLYFLVAGRYAFPDLGRERTLELVRSGQHPPLGQLVRTAPRRWISAVEAALCVEVDARAQTAEEVAQAWFEGTSARPLMASRTAPVGQVALVFTDVQGSTGLWEADEEVARHTLRAHDAVVRAALNRHGGFEVKTEGDSFMVAFAEPFQAVAFCLDVQRDLHDHPWSEAFRALPQAREEPGFHGVRVRMGVHVGRPEVRTRGGRVDYFGPMVNRAARIAAAGHGGQILLSERVCGMVRARLRGAVLEELGAHALRGLAGAERLVQVLPERLRERCFPPLTAERVE